MSAYAWLPVLAPMYGASANSCRENNIGVTVTAEEQNIPKSNGGGLQNDPNSVVSDVRPRAGVMARCCRGLLHLVAGMTAGVTIVVLVLAWHLSSGPISLGFLTPYIEDALNAKSPDVNISMGDTILTWAGWERALDIRVLNVRATDGKGVVVAAIPEISFSLSTTALIRRGAIVPKTVELFGPRLTLRRNSDGSFGIDLGRPEGEQGFADGRNLGSGLFSMLFDKPRAGSPVAYLTRLNVIGAEAIIEDRVLHRRWTAPSADIRLTRDVLGITGEVALQMDLDGRVSEVRAKGSYQIDERRLGLSIDFDELDPKSLAEFHPDLRRFAGLQIPLKGTVTLGMSVDGAPDEIGFRLLGGAGLVQMPGLVPEIIPVQDIVLNGFFDGRARIAEVHEFALTAKPGTTIGSPGSRSHRLPIVGMKFSGKYALDEDRLDMSRLEITSDGPTATVSGTIEDTTGAATAALAIKLQNVPLKGVDRYWAPEWGEDVYNWWVANITDGIVPRAEAKVRIRKQANGWALVSAAGDMDLRDGTLTYLEGMPEVKAVNARADFTQKRFDVFITSGKSDGMVVDDAQVFLTDVDTNHERAEIIVNVAGDMTHALKLINHQPLGYAKKMGVKPAGAKGQARVRLTVKLPLALDLNLDDVDISADARLRNAALPKALHGFDLSQADLTLSVNKRGMDVKGRGSVAGMPAEITWRENFGEKVAFRTILDLSGRVPDITTIGNLGINLGPLDDDYLDGAIGANVRFTVLNEKETRIEIRADLEDAQLSVEEVKWSKPVGAAGRAEMNLSLRDGKVQTIDHFALYAENMAVSGRAAFDADSPALRRIDFSQITFGRTDMKGALIRRADGAWDLGFHGAGLDLTEFWKDFSEEEGADTLGDFIIAAEFDRVWLDDRKVLSNVSATVARETDIWRTILVRSILNDDVALEVSLKPESDGNRSLSIKTADAGAVLRAMDVYENMLGGALELTGQFDDSRPERPLNGRLLIRDYRVTKAPALAHLVSIMALTGILDALQGDGLGFAVLDIPFTMQRGVIEITDARAAGTSLGFTASGIFYTHADVVDLQGTVVPAYALNSALGRIPLVGGLFSGGEKGSGLFAANFTLVGPQEDPKITINPLSALAPGFLRQLFGVFGETPGSSHINPDPFLTLQ